MDVVRDIWSGKLRFAEVTHPDLAVVQDIAVQAGQGRIEDRQSERLGRSDAGIILWRKILTRELRAIAEGRRRRNGRRRRPTSCRRWGFSKRGCCASPLSASQGADNQPGVFFPTKSRGGGGTDGLAEFFSSRTPYEFSLTCIIIAFGLIIILLLL